MKKVILLVAAVMIALCVLSAAAESAVAVKNIVPAEKKVALAPGATWQAVVTVSPENATDKGVTWTSGDERVATVDENGVVTGVKKGKCKVTATARDGSKKKADINVEVKDYDVVILHPVIADTYFDTTDDYAEYEVSFMNNSKRTVYQRTVTFKGDVVESAGERKLRPVKTGEGTIEVVVKENKKVKEKGKYTVYVAEAATNGEIQDTIDLARGKPSGASSELPAFWRYNANDGDIETYWESSGYPAEWTADLETVLNVSSVVIRLNPDKSWEPRTQTIEVLVSADGENYETVAAEREYKYDPKKGNMVCVGIDPVDARLVRLRFTGGSWANAQAAEIQINVTADQRALDEQQRIQDDPFYMTDW